MGSDTHLKKKQIKTELIRLLDRKCISYELVLAIAGDKPISSYDKHTLELLQQKMGERFYSEILFQIVNHYFPPKKAKELWKGILAHRQLLNQHLKRNVGLSVAALDYLTNIVKELHAVSLINRSKMNTIAEVAVRDGLTGLFDHATFFEKLSQELQRFRRYQCEFCIILFDLDNFKKFNDTYGHPAGDALLKKIAKLIHATIREVDLASRYGGEEFAILLPQTPLCGACTLTERLRKSIAQFPENITASFGLAHCPEHAQLPETLIQCADAALYLAKKKGKNQYQIASPYQPNP